MTLTRTTCPYCGVGCGVLAAADGTIKGDPAHPANLGRLCSKGAALGETLDLDGRLLAPRVDGKPAEWDTAINRVADAFRTAIRDHGPDSVALYVSGQSLTEDYYVANKLMKGFIGAANIDTNSRLCMASSVAGHKRAFGTDTVPGTYEDLEEADLIVLVGSNLAWCHPVLYQRIVAAKQARPEMRVVNIDPRRTATSDLADLHLGVAPDGDVALFNGLLAHLAATDAIDLGFVQDHVNGCLDAVTEARRTDLSVTGLNTQQLEEFYSLWAGTEKVVTVYSQGVNQSSIGTDKVNAILNCHLATGRIGKPGMGPFSVTGQPNAMGGREVGGLANMLANHLDIENEDHRAAVQAFWQSPTICTRPGLKAVDLFDACADGRIKALWVISTNPAVSMPNADHVAKAIENVPFVAVSDIMARTDTGDLADVMLPATGWGEKDGTVTNSERRISRQRAFLPAPGQARPDWRIICDVAAAMGWGEAFDYADPSEIFAEYVALSKAAKGFGKDLDLSAWAAIDYATMAPRQWPQDDTRFFGDGAFFHPDGRARMIATPAATAAVPTGLMLNNGRNRDQWHTMTRTGKSARLSAHLAEPYLEINPADAEACGLRPADLARVRGASGGNAILRVWISATAPKGAPFAPMHWTGQLTSAGRVNVATRADVDPVSGQPSFKHAPVRVERYDAAWYGFLASAEPLTPQTGYAAIAKTPTGWQAELAGETAPDDWEAMIRQLTGIADGEVASMHDPRKNLTRVAIRREGRLVALLFAGPEPVALSRRHAVSQIGTEAEVLLALSGRAGQSQPDPGAIVCACHDVGVNTLRSAIASGATTVAALGEQTCAGTNCGSCRSELAGLIAAAQMKVAAE